jgi:hypothetical protein
MWIVQPLTKQHTKAALRAVLGMMSQEMTDKAATQTEE